MKHRARRILAAGAWAVCLSAACVDRDGAAEAEAEARARIEAEFGRRDLPGDTAAAGEDQPAPARESAPESRPVSEVRPRTEEASDRGDATGGAEGEGGGPSREAAGHPSSAGRSEDADPSPESPAPSDPPSGDQGVDDLLSRAEEAYAGLERLRAAFSQRIENPLLGRTREGRGMWYQAGRNRFRMDFEIPANDLYVADGSCLWLYEPSQHDQVVVSRLEEGVELGTIDILGRLLSEARTRYAAVAAGVEGIDGTETRLVTLTPRQLPARYVEVHLWIGVADRYVRRFRVREENETVRTVTLTRLEPQAPIDPSVFAFTPPPGVPIFPDDVRCG